MSADLVLFGIATAGAGVAALFAVLAFFRMRQAPTALTAQGASQILRAETDIVRAVIEDQARGLRQELGQSLKGFQELTLAAFGTLRDGIEAQVRGFGERLDVGTKATDERAAAISAKLDDEMTQERSEANTNRETLRTLIEQKLDHSIGQQADASKIIRDELGGNFHRLGTRVSDSLTEAGQIQKERLENVTGALTGLSEKLEKAQDSREQPSRVGSTRSGKRARASSKKCDKQSMRNYRPRSKPGWKNFSIGWSSSLSGFTRASERCRPSPQMSVICETYSRT